MSNELESIGCDIVYGTILAFWLELPRKLTEIINQDGRCLDQDSNHLLPEQEPDALASGPTRSSGIL
jgi:hypothetical protein